MQQIETENELVKKWEQEQIEMKKRLKLYDTEPWEINKNLYGKNSESNENESLRFVAGFDISFIKNTNKACSGLFVFDLSSNMSMVYYDLDKEPVVINQPYIPGYLAYREAPFLLSKLNKLKNEFPFYYPQCLLIDGNGVLHINKFGMACHVGVICDIPTIGVSKTLYQVFGLENNQYHKEKIKNLLKEQGDYFELISNEPVPSILGICYRSTSNSTNPIYVSIGNKISLNTCLWVIGLVTKSYRIPEPIRQADLKTREHLRKFIQ